MLTAVFDIGKTNKKFILFDEELSVVDSRSVQFGEVVDDDSDPCEDLDGLVAWITGLVEEVVAERGGFGARDDVKGDAPGNAAGRASSGAARLGRINFSTYGASLVHLDDLGKPVTPLYNYLKPYPEELLKTFHKAYGPADDFAAATGSPTWGMLNSGLQLYWLKHQKPELFNRIRRSLHLPQYCSYLLTGHAHDEPTSLGCHTAMWDFGRGDYHGWLESEAVSHLVPARVQSTELFPLVLSGLMSPGSAPSDVMVGAGVHDSSAALYPYLKAFDEPFVFISTGTWIVTMNPFGDAQLSAADVRGGALCYMTPSLKPVKSVRMFLGHEHDLQLARIASAFGVNPEQLSSLPLDDAALASARAQVRETGTQFVPSVHLASGESADVERRSTWDPSQFRTAEVAYHALVDALVSLQLEALKAATGSTPVRRMFIDGGFAGNKLFLTLLARAVHPTELATTELSQATALGAALLVQERVDSDRLKALLNTHVVPLR